MSIEAILKVTHNGKDITGRDDERPENIPVRAWRIIMKSGWMKAGIHWHQVYLPLHFSKAAFLRYPQVYQRRSNAYFRRHLKDMVGEGQERRSTEDLSDAIRTARSRHRPLVFSGTLEAYTQQATVRAFQTRVAVVIPVPSYVSKRVRGGGVDIYAELTTVNSAERQTLNGIVSRQVEAAAERFLESRTLPSLAG